MDEKFNKALQAVTDEIEAKAKKRREELATINGKIAEEKKLAEAAIEKMDAALYADDATGYSKAKKQKVEAEDAIEMHERRLAMLHDEHAQRNGDFERIRAELIRLRSEITQVTTEKIKSLNAAIDEARCESAKACGLVNQAFYRLQADAYGMKNADHAL